MDRLRRFHSTKQWRSYLLVGGKISYHWGEEQHGSMWCCCGKQHLPLHLQNGAIPYARGMAGGEWGACAEGRDYWTCTGKETWVVPPLALHLEAHLLWALASWSTKCYGDNITYGDSYLDPDCWTRYRKGKLKVQKRSDSALCPSQLQQSRSKMSKWWQIVISIHCLYCLWTLDSTCLWDHHVSLVPLKLQLKFLFHLCTSVGSKIPPPPKCGIWSKFLTSDK